MCSHCTGRVDKALNALDGVTATVSLEDKAAYVTVDGAVTDEELKKAVVSVLICISSVRSVSFLLSCPLCFFRKPDWNPFSLNALQTTNTELKLMAALPNIGLNCQFSNG